MRPRTVFVTSAALLALAGCGGSAAHTPAHSATPAPAASTVPASTPATVMTCARSTARTLARDMRHQDRLAAVAFPPGSGISRATVASIRAGAWTDPGIYSADLDHFVAIGTGTTSPSQPARLGADAWAGVTAATLLTADKKVGAVTVSDWQQFKAAITALAADCGVRA